MRGFRAPGARKRHRPGHPARPLKIWHSSQIWQSGWSASPPVPDLGIRDPWLTSDMASGTLKCGVSGAPGAPETVSPGPWPALALGVFMGAPMKTRNRAGRPALQSRIWGSGTPGLTATERSPLVATTAKSRKSYRTLRTRAFQALVPHVPPLFRLFTCGFPRSQSSPPMSATVRTSVALTSTHPLDEDAYSNRCRYLRHLRSLQGLVGPSARNRSGYPYPLLQFSAGRQRTMRGSEGSWSPRNGRRSRRLWPMVWSDVERVARELDQRCWSISQSQPILWSAQPSTSARQASNTSPPLSRGGPGPIGARSTHYVAMCRPRPLPSGDATGQANGLAWPPGGLLNGIPCASKADGLGHPLVSVTRPSQAAALCQSQALRPAPNAGWWAPGAHHCGVPWAPGAQGTVRRGRWPRLQVAALPGRDVGRPAPHPWAIVEADGLSSGRNSPRCGLVLVIAACRCSRCGAGHPAGGGVPPPSRGSWSP